MTLLTACQSAAVRLIGLKPSTFLSSSEPFEMKMVDLANDVARDIAESYDWQALTALKEYPGDGTTVGFDLPTDYSRMLVDGDVARANWYTWHYLGARDLNIWRNLVNGLSTPNPGYWIILNNQMQFQPPISNGDTAQFYYISKNFARAADNSTKPAFTADSDTFVLDETLLTLGLIWRYRSQERLEYAEDMANYEKAFAERSGRDKGSRVLTLGRRNRSGDIRFAYPMSLG